MKAKKLYAYALLCVLALGTCASSCSGDNDEPTPKPEETKGEVSYVIDNGNGGGSTTAPTVVTNGEPLNMTISQKSSYTDSDGKVFTCEPKATVSLKVAIDTICVKDLATLTSVKQKGNPTTSTNGTNPVQTKIMQTFEIDGKTISAFDLGYEIYRYTNAANQTVEMPYIKLNPAAYGAAKTASDTRGEVAVTSIRLTPINPSAATRGVEVKDTAMYKVSVSFNLNMQSQNTGKDETTPLNFEAEFVGIVENTTELPDPAFNFNYQLNILGGTVSTASPFAVTLGEELSLEWVQNSQYTYFSAIERSGKTVDEKPRATVKLIVAKDTLWVNSAEELEKVSETTPVETTSGDNPIKYATKQSFDIGGKTIDIDWSYEAYAKETINDKEVMFPYLKLDKAKVTSVSKTELSNEDVLGKTAKAYEITVTLSQSLSGVNTPEAVAETVEYIVKYIAVVVSDPITRFSYQFNILGGTASTASPFAVTLGEELSLEWTQNSQYTYFSATEKKSKTVSGQPKATVKLIVSKDTLWANSVEDLEKVSEATPVETTSGDNKPVKYETKQSLNIGGKTIDIDWSYEAYAKQNINGTEVTLPSLKLDKAKVTNVSKTELPNEAVLGKRGKAYEMTVTLSQSLSGVNTPEAIAETVTYVVKYIVAVEAKLISTTYEKDYFWTEPHDNMHWMSYYRIYRTRTYSTGEKETDTFTYPYGHRVEHVVTADVQGTDDYIHSSEYQVGNYHFIYHNQVTGENNNDFIKVYYFKTGVPDLSLLNGVVTRDENQWADRGDLSSYTSPIYKYQDKPLQYNPQNPIEGWYAKDIEYNRRVDLLYNQHPFVRMYDMGIRFYDSILYLDNQLFDFSDYRMTYDFDFREQSTALPDGSPAKVFTHECKAKYLGKDFYVATVDTVYQIK